MKTTNSKLLKEIKLLTPISLSLCALLSCGTGAFAQSYSGHIESGDTPNSIPLIESEKAVQESESMLVQISDLSTQARIAHKGICDPASFAALKSIYCNLSIMNRDLSEAESSLKIALADLRDEPGPEKQEVVNLTQHYYDLCVRSYATAQGLLNECRLS